ncbi:MAG: hypothetical protein QW051_04105 [Candidatus Aenigmatarchaeota archaeon]
MKVIKIIISSLLLIFFVGQYTVESRTVFIAPAGHHWLSPNGKCSENGVPKSKPTQDPETGSVSIGGGCDPAQGLCWEITGNNDEILIIYDLVIHPGPGKDVVFVPVTDSLPHCSKSEN